MKKKSEYIIYCATNMRHSTGKMGRCDFQAPPKPFTEATKLSWLLQFACYCVKMQKISLLYETFFPVQFFKQFYFTFLKRKKDFNMATLTLYE